jgi:hypothetical protein
MRGAHRSTPYLPREPPRKARLWNLDSAPEFVKPGKYRNQRAKLASAARLDAQRVAGAFVPKAIRQFIRAAARIPWSAPQRFVVAIRFKKLDVWSGLSIRRFPRRRVQCEA